MNVGIIGYGKMGQLRHAEIDKVDNVDVLCIFDENEEFVPDQNRCRNANAIIENQCIDGVFICTPNYLNYPLTLAALNQGKHVFCEKPPVFTGAQMRTIRTAEVHSGKKLMYGFNHRHHDSIKKMKSLVESGVYGKVLWMRGRYGKSVDSSFYSTWRAKKKYAGGGILMDQGIHMLDLFIHLSGEFDQTKSFLSNLYWQGDVEDNAFVTLRNSKTGVTASLHSTMTQWRHLFSLEVFLDKGYMALNGLKTSSGTYGEETLSIAQCRSTAPAATWEDEEHFKYSVNNSWESEITHFFNAIKKDTSIQYGSSSDAQALMDTIDAVYKEPIEKVNTVREQSV